MSEIKKPFAKITPELRKMFRDKFDEFIENIPDKVDNFDFSCNTGYFHLRIRDGDY